MNYLYLHGLGQGPDRWKTVIRKTAVSGGSVCPDLAKLTGDSPLSYPALYDAVSRLCGEMDGDLTLCGLSLGGVLALHYAADHPEGVKALVLVAAQYKMPKRLLKFQNFLFRLMPKALLRQTGFEKADLLRLCGSMANLDLTDSLRHVSCPTLILCGEKDRANKKASQELADRLPYSVFREVPGAGHEVNSDAPQELAALLQSFYTELQEKK